MVCVEGRSYSVMDVGEAMTKEYRVRIESPELLQGTHAAICDLCVKFKIVRITLVGSPIGGELGDNRAGLRLCAECHRNTIKEAQ